MPAENCKARKVMAVGKHTFSHTMVTVTECAFCMRDWMTVVMTDFTVEFSAVQYSIVQHKNIAFLLGLAKKENCSSILS